MYFEPNMTQDMLDVLQDFRAMYEAEIGLCTEQLAKAHEASNISLPSEAADGTPVLHGARTAIDGITQYWSLRLDAAERMVRYM